MKRNALIGLILSMILALAITGIAPAPVFAANPAPVQLYYVTLPEGDALSFFDSVDTDGGASDPNRPISAYTSISVAADGTYVYYDQWENGYAADIANPTAAEIYDATTNPGGVQIWGNGVAADGCAPNDAGVPVTCTDANDVLNAGQVIILYNDVDVAMYDVADWFDTVAYNNNNGVTSNWAAAWVETGDGTTSPTSGDIQIISNQLRFTGTDAGDSISRRVSMPTGAGCATVSFDLDAPSKPNGDNNEEIRIEVDDDGGAIWTELWTFDADGTNDERHRWGFDLPSDEVSANTVIRFRSIDTLGDTEYWTIDNVKVMWGCGNNPAKVVYDAKDKVGASKSIAMAKSVWAAGTVTLLSFAHEIYPTAEWGTAYESPVGQNTASPGTSMFQGSALSIMAAENNTSVQIDVGGDGTYETTTILNEGGSYYATGVQQGARVQATKPVQVVLLTGDIGDTFEARDMTLLPTSAYGTSLWAAAGTEYPDNARFTRLWLYNPTVNGSSIYITCERYGVANTTSTLIAARGVWTVTLDQAQGGRCYASNSNGDIDNTKVIFGIGAIDAEAGDSGGTDGSQSDWGYTLYPDGFLSTEALVGLGLGRDPLATVDTERNISPLWINPACSSGSTYVYVDWNNDGTADQVDLNGDGDVVDTLYGISEATSSQGMLVPRLRSLPVWEPGLDDEEFDQTGARVWTRTVSGVGYEGTPGCKLAVAWGQDLVLGGTYIAIPALDSGATVPPLRLQEGTKSLVLKTDADGNGQLSPGDTATYNMTVTNTGPGAVNNVHLYDTVPANTTYVSNTTQKDIGADWVAIPDDGTGTAFPLDAEPNGVELGDGLDTSETWNVRFDVTLQPGTYEEIQNCDVVTSDAGRFRACTTNPVASKDWGDLPDSYGTSAAANGPRHSSSGLMLGSLWDVNLQGIPSVGADGDDLQYQDDEDGVVIAAGNGGGWSAGSGAFQVSVTGGPGCLNAWMDFTDDAGSGAGTSSADGNFTDGEAGSPYDEYSTFSEYIVQNLLVSSGTNYVPVTVPPNLFSPSSNSYYLRFRLSPTAGGVCNTTTATTPTGAWTGGEVEDYRFSLNLGTIGDYVWVDEDGDGDQDAGEVGIPNVTVYLYAAGPDGVPGTSYDVLVGTTWTDANGGYVFTDRVPGVYTVKVDSATLPSELAPNPTYDEDGIATANSSVVTLGPGEEHMTADFGYNYSSPCETNTPGAAGCLNPTGAIGDRVWVDSDGDGKQDTEEIGIKDVTVAIFVDSDGDGQYDDPYDMDPGTSGIQNTTTTDANGYYIFDGLPAGAYAVTVTTPPAEYTQTGDPDHFGTTGTNNDNTTTTPVVLGPGDVFLNADFGYQPPTTQVGAIGDYVWLDADADAVQDAGEYGINNVTVSLIQDGNGNGTWDAGEPIIATTITGDNPETPGVETGWYQFTGLPAGAGQDYLVWINDAGHVLHDLAPTYDSNGIGTPNISSVQDLTTAGNQLQDFGYAPANYTTGEGLIGDYVWLDADGDGAQDAGEDGLEGVTVRLLDADGNLLATTVTNENGHYYFGDLPVSAGGVTYQVQVVAATLPAGLTQTYDYDGAGTANASTVTLTTAAPVRLDQDFGYQGLNTISGTIWTDTDADSLLEGTEAGRFAGVTVVLRDANGDIVATTVTDVNGDFSFTGLPDGSYYVDVTDDANVLNGYWKSNCAAPNCGQNNYSQVDPYPVTVGPEKRTDDTADFGYYVLPAAVGNWVWYDRVSDGIQDPDGANNTLGDGDDEIAIPGATVTLTIVWPNSATTTLVTTTDTNGYYSFGNLLLDEDQNGLTTYGAEPSFTISMTPPTNYPYPTEFDEGDSDALDADNYHGVVATPIQGTVDNTYDFGWRTEPLAATLAAFIVELSPDGVVIAWETVSELNNSGFNLYRAESVEGPWSQINEALIAAVTPGSSEGHAYQWTDAAIDASTPGTYWYALEDVALDGTATRHEPIGVVLSEPSEPNALSLNGFAGAPTGFVWPALAALGGLAFAALARANHRRR